MANISDASGAIRINEKLMGDKEAWKLTKELLSFNVDARNTYEYYASLNEKVVDGRVDYDFYGVGRWSLLNTIDKTFLWDVIELKMTQENPEVKHSEVVAATKEIVKKLRKVIGDDYFFEAEYTDYEPGGEYFVDIEMRAYLPDEVVDDGKPVPLKISVDNVYSRDFTYDNVVEFDEDVIKKTRENIEEYVRMYVPSGTSEERIQEIIDAIDEDYDDYFYEYTPDNYI